jgi:hypothetical protein
MKLLPLAMIAAMTVPTAFAGDDEGYMSATGYAAGYAGHVTSDVAGQVMNGAEDVGHAVAVPTKQAARSVWGFLSDIGNGMEKSKAIATGDGVNINASVYSLALRQAERDNSALNTLQKERDERQYNLKRAQEETERLKKLSSDYKEDASKFQSNINTTLVGIAEAAKKMDGWDKAHQANLDQLIEEHKKLGKLTAEDGKARIGSQTLVSMNKAWVDIEDFVKKSPDAAKAAGLDTRMKSMSSLLSGATDRMQEKEKQMMAATAKINELSKIDEKKVADDEASMKRQMILGTLNNSVNNLITSAEFSKVRSQLAFSHFKDIEASMAEKGVKAGDVKNLYKKNINTLASQYNNTPFGLYVNSQIAKAMGSVCELVNNQCKDGTNSALFDFLDDSSRFNFKMPADQSGSTSTDSTSTTKK